MAGVCVQSAALASWLLSKTGLLDPAVPASRMRVASRLPIQGGTARGQDVSLIASCVAARWLLCLEVKAQPGHMANAGT